MNRLSRANIIVALNQILDNYENGAYGNETVGLCYQIRAELYDHNRTEYILIKRYQVRAQAQWIHFSGDENYPIPFAPHNPQNLFHPDDYKSIEFDSKAHQIYTHSSYKWRGSYGEMRVAYLKHLIQFFTKLN